MRYNHTGKLRRTLSLVSGVACAIALSSGLFASAEGEAALTNFVTDKMDLASGGTNLIVNGDFEADPAAGSGWNVDSFTGVATVVSEGAHGGSKMVTFTAGADGATAKFTVAVEANTEYMFSAWVKGGLLSDENAGDLNFGVADGEGNFLSIADNVNSSATKALTPPAWDNAWHQRGYTFNTGSLTTITVQITGTGTAASFDDLVLCKADQAQGKVVANPDAPKVSAPAEDKMNCAVEDNLFENFDFSGSDHSFWTDVEGYADIFGFAEDNGNPVLKTTGKNTGLSYIKWIDVEKNTDYTFTADLKGLETDEDANVSFGLMIHNGVQPKSFGEIEIPFDGLWNLTSFTFNSGDYDRIGFFIYGGSGELELDNVRLFEAAKGTELTDDDTNVSDNPDPIVPTDPSNPTTPGGDPEEPDQPGTPGGDEDIDPGKTGVAFNVMALVLAIGSAAAAGLVLLLKRRRA